MNEFDPNATPFCDDDIHRIDMNHKGLLIYVVDLNCARKLERRARLAEEKLRLEKEELDQTKEKLRIAVEALSLSAYSDGSWLPEYSVRALKKIERVGKQ